MTQTVIGVFDSYQDADTAVENLLAIGIARSDMEVHSHAADVDASSTSTTGGVRTEANQEDGILDKIERFFSNLTGGDDRPPEFQHYHEAVRRGGALVSVDVRDEAQLDSVRTVLETSGALDIDERVAQWQGSGYAAYSPSTQQTTGATAAGTAGMAGSADMTPASQTLSATQPVSSTVTEGTEQAFPVVQEELEVGKRQVQTGAFRVYSRRTETPVSESVTLREEHASIERRSVDRPATEADLKEGFVEVRETEEMPVIQKSARVVEEVVVGKEASQRTETVTDTVRGTSVEVERVDQDGVTSSDDPLKPRKDGL